MTTVDPKWKKLGSSSNADFYEISSDVLGILPFENSTDDETTARESIAFQERHWRAVGHPGAVVVFMDAVVQQVASARAVYADEVGSLSTTCFALVGETFYGYATSQVFTGLSKPGKPTNVFKSLDDARPWLAEMNEAQGGRM